MLWTNRVNKIAGVTLLLLAGALIISVVSSIASEEDADPFDRQDIQEFLVNINDNEAAAFVGTIADFAVDAFIGVVAAALFYLIFRDRNRLLALSGFALLLAASAAFMASDAAQPALILLAQDFVEKGGPQGIEAGDAVILEVARAVAMWSLVAEQVAFTALSLGFVAIGSLIAWAPAGAVTPPRWLGWLAVLAGVAGVASWLVALEEGFFVLFLISGIATLLFLIILGGWLLTAPEAKETPAPAS